MNPHATRHLELLFKLALDSDAKEIRLESDLPPCLLLRSGVQATRLPPMQSISIYALHEECLFLAGRSDLRGIQDSEYTFASSSSGAWRCRTTFPGAKIILTMTRSGTSYSQAVVSPKRSPPKLRDEVSTASIDRDTEGEADA